VALQRHRHVVLARERAAELVEPDGVLLDQAGAEPTAVDRLRLERAIDLLGGAEALGDQELADPLVAPLRRR
jgi:hypothetical protein